MVTSKVSPETTDVGSVLTAVVGDARAGRAITAANMTAATMERNLLSTLFLIFPLLLFKVHHHDLQPQR